MPDRILEVEQDFGKPIQVLVEEWRRESTFRTIAAIIGISENTLRRWRKKWGMPIGAERKQDEFSARKSWVDQRAKELDFDSAADLIRSYKFSSGGLSDERIGEILECCRCTVHNYKPVELRGIWAKPKGRNPPGPHPWGALMKKIAIDEAPAGLAMDAAVAEALGCNVTIEKYEGRQVAFCNCRSREHENPMTYVSLMLKRYSTDIAAAWELAELKGLALVPQSEGDGFHWLALDLERVIYSGNIALVEKDETACSAKTAPLAICRTFLKVNGIEYVEVERTAENNA